MYEDVYFECSGYPNYLWSIKPEIWKKIGDQILLLRLYDVKAYVCMTSEHRRTTLPFKMYIYEDYSRRVTHYKTPEGVIAAIQRYIERLV